MAEGQQPLPPKRQTTPRFCVVVPRKRLSPSLGALAALLLLSVFFQASSSETTVLAPKREGPAAAANANANAKATSAAAGSPVHHRSFRRGLRQDTECILYLGLLEREPGAGIRGGGKAGSTSHEAVWSCELPMEAVGGEGSTVPGMGGTTGGFGSSSSMGTMLVAIEGLRPGFFEEGGAVSGATILRISEGCYLEGTRTSPGPQGKTKGTLKTRDPATILTRMVVPPEATVELSAQGQGSASPIFFHRTRNLRPRGKSSNSRSSYPHPRGPVDHDPDHPLVHRAIPTVGSLTTLVVRVVGPSGIAPVDDIEATRNNVFQDAVCLKSQIEACSKGQLVIDPFSGTTQAGKVVEGGVVDVAIDVDPAPGNRDILKHRANWMATRVLGNLEEQFDLVLFCLPPGTGRDWIGFASVGRFDSYYNNQWCGRVSIQLHEVGHSLNLAHSGEKKAGTSDYDDQSGMMGFSYPRDDWPRMCFNPAKSYQLGWYKRQQLAIDPTKMLLADHQGYGVEGEGEGESESYGIGYDTDDDTDDDTVSTAKPISTTTTETSATSVFVFNGVADYRATDDYYDDYIGDDDDDSNHHNATAVFPASADADADAGDNDHTDDRAVVVLRLRETGSGTDYFVGFNRASGANQETQEDANEIVVVEKPSGGSYGYGQSWKVAALGTKGQSIVVPFRGSLVSAFVEIKLLADTTTGYSGSNTNTNQAPINAPVAITSYRRADPCGNGERTLLFEARGMTDGLGGREASWSLRVDPDKKASGNNADENAASASGARGGYLGFGSGYGPRESFRRDFEVCQNTCYIFAISETGGDDPSGSEGEAAWGGVVEGFLNGEKVFDTRDEPKQNQKQNHEPPEHDLHSHSHSYSFCIDPLPLCRDSPTFRIRTGKGKNKKTRKGCKWVRENPKKRCRRQWKGKPLSKRCPVSCDLC
ncbi:unnamed protein product [Pseudo-nitzschia multistriata]|uniref:Peptidase M11 gametolysin domain-containing protein n=1 Tax=Pseudo-nitzschia multistriata TaxID=183589 RepID=A0A448ZE07_9STRA|nr:unnamed protein product [Pseudo-nitzschia multistriata]